MDEGLPIEVIKALEDKNRAQLKHKWLWSFMPVDRRAGNIEYDTQIYLVGYCPVCDNTITRLAPTDYQGQVKLNLAGVPKWGCIPVQELE